jgi:hypothetical protein
MRLSNDWDRGLTGCLRDPRLFVSSVQILGVIYASGECRMLPLSTALALALAILKIPAHKMWGFLFAKKKRVYQVEGPSDASAALLF